MLKLYKVEGCERFWLAAETADEAQKRLIADELIDEQEIGSFEVSEMDSNYLLRVCVDDDPNDTTLPVTPIRADDGHWYCIAPAAAWIVNAKSGDMICSTLY